MSPTAISLAFVLLRPEVGTIPVGSCNIGHIEDNIRALDIKLQPSDIERLMGVSAKVPRPEIVISTKVVEVLEHGRIAAASWGEGKSP